MSTYIVYVELDGFYIRTLGLSKDQPAVVHRDKIVLDLNTSAECRGLTRQMGLAEAKAMLGRDGLYVAWEGDSFIKDQEEWLDLVTEFADTVEPVSQHRCLADLSAHPDPAYIAAKIRQALSEKTSCKVRLGAGSCRWIAEIRCRVPDRPVCTLAVYHLPVANEISQRLFALGCRTIGDVANTSLEQLRRQFGSEAHQIHQSAKEQGDHAVKSAYPPNSISDRFLFEGVADARETLENGIRKLAQRVGAKLVNEAKYSKQLCVWLENEDGVLELRERAFGKPIGSPASLLVALTLILGQVDYPVSSIRLRLPDLQAKQRVQRTFTGITSNDSKGDAVQNALGQLRGKFGSNSILLADQVAVERYQRVRQAWRAVNGWSWK